MYVYVDTVKFTTSSTEGKSNIYMRYSVLLTVLPNLYSVCSVQTSQLHCHDLMLLKTMTRLCRLNTEIYWGYSHHTIPFKELKM